MRPMSNGRGKVLVWLEPRQVGMVRRVLDAAGLVCAGVGCPEAGRGASMAAELGPEAKGVRDLRAALGGGAGGAGGAGGGEDVQLVWLASGAGLGDDESGVVDALRACAGRGVKVVSGEPVPASLLAPVADGSGPGAAAGIVVPTWRASDGLLAGVDALANFGPVVSATLTWLSPPDGDGGGSGGDGGGATLAAVLLDALDMLDALVGEPAKIDGAYVDANVGKPGLPARPTPGETLRGLAGAFTIGARAEDGRAAVIHASDRASVWRREVLAVGPGGTMRFTDDGLEWRRGAGEIVERGGEFGVMGLSSAPMTAEGAMSRSLSRVLAGTLTPMSRASVQRIRASAGAALLSARTGQNESPALIARMTGGG
jgi:hypothetical protein